MFTAVDLFHQQLPHCNHELTIHANIYVQLQNGKHLFFFFASVQICVHTQARTCNRKAGGESMGLSCIPLTFRKRHATLLSSLHNYLFKDAAFAEVKRVKKTDDLRRSGDFKRELEQIII